VLQQAVDSAWHLPAITVFSITLLFLVIVRRLPFIVGFCVFFGWTMILDAWFSGPVSPVTGGYKTFVDFLFVFIGDLRYFILLERYRSGRNMTGRNWTYALMRTCIAPAVVLIAIVSRHGSIDASTMYLIYEIAFCVIVLTTFFAMLPGWRALPVEDGSFLKSLTYFELLQYGLWVAGDLLLVAGQSWGMSVRMSANICYYSLFVPFVWWRSPDAPKERRTLTPVTATAIAALALSFAPLAAHRIARPVQAADSSAALTFMQGGKSVSSLPLSQMLQSMPVEQISAFDPYYQHNKRWRAVPVEQLLMSGFNREVTGMTDQEFVLRASDGFAAYFPGARLLEGGAYVAIEDLDKQPDWEPIGERKDNPGPFYLIWAKPNQQDLETHARPWQLASIEIVTFDSQFPHVRPEGEGLALEAEQGFEIFRVQCLPCHSINRAGGKVGPELNVPQNILEYRDPAVLRTFIKNPQSFRYTVMPAHPDMTPEQLDDLIAYFRVMKNQKHDQ
jgi:mono/diheme cytochrome c family protein